jgi:hypothetical protein
MKRLLMFLIPVLLLAACGCETQMKDVMVLPSQSLGKVPEMMTVSEKGTYYLYSSKAPKTVVYKKELKKGDELGFSVHGDSAWAKAAGVRIQLDDYSEGTTYTWKIEEKKKE